MKNTKGELSTGVIIGIILLIIIVVGLIIWSRSNKSDMALETDSYGNTVMINDQAQPSSTNNDAPMTNPDTQTQTTTTTTTTVTPTLPQTGFGPDEE